MWLLWRQRCWGIYLLHVIFPWVFHSLGVHISVYKAWPVVTQLVKWPSQHCVITYQVQSPSAASVSGATGCEVKLVCLPTSKLALQGQSLWAGSWRMTVLCMASRYWGPQMKWGKSITCERRASVSQPTATLAISEEEMTLSIAVAIILSSRVPGPSWAYYIEAAEKMFMEKADSKKKILQILSRYEN